MSYADSWKALEAPLACGVLRTPLIGVQQQHSSAGQRRQRVSLTAPMMASLVIVRSSLTQRMALPMACLTPCAPMGLAGAMQLSPAQPKQGHKGPPS
jgi:hypothetical protein